MIRRFRTVLAATVLALANAMSALADPAPFDLAGPNLDVKVTRGAQTLPISQVPNLATGDHLSIKADFPASQSAHYLLIAAFVCAIIAATKGRNPLGWGILGLFFSILTLIVVIVIPSKK